MHTPVNIFKQLINLTCKQASLLASRTLDERLSLHEGLRLRWHLLTCPDCAHYFKQIKLIRKVIRHKEESAVRLPYEARLRITQALTKAATKNTVNK